MHRLFYIIILIVCIFLDVFLFPISSDYRIFGILLFFLFLVHRYKYNSSLSFLLALFFLVISFILYVFASPDAFAVPIVPKTERVAVWVYLFILIGVIKKWRE